VSIQELVIALQCRAMHAKLRLLVLKVDHIKVNNTGNDCVLRVSTELKAFSHGLQRLALLRSFSCHCCSVLMRFIRVVHSFCRALPAPQLITAATD